MVSIQGGPSHVLPHPLNLIVATSGIVSSPEKLHNHLVYGILSYTSHRKQYLLLPMEYHDALDLPAVVLFIYVFVVIPLVALVTLVGLVSSGRISHISKSGGEWGSGEVCFLIWLCNTYVEFLQALPVSL